MKLAFLKRDISKRTAFIAAALIAAAGVVAGRERPSPEVIVETRAARTADTAPMPDLDLAKLERHEAHAPQNDPFAPRSFAPPPRPAPAPVASAPVAPPLPFAYAGKITADGKTEVLVLRGDEIISIAAGQKIDAEYRVDAITPSSISFTYLPLKTRQSLEVAEGGA